MPLLPNWRLVFFLIVWLFPLSHVLSIKYVLSKWHICTAYIFSSPCFHFIFHQVFVSISKDSVIPQLTGFSFVPFILKSQLPLIIFCPQLPIFSLELWLYTTLLFLCIWQISLLPCVLFFLDSSHYVILRILQTSIFCLLTLLLHHSIYSILCFQLKLATGLDITSMANDSH